MNLLLLDPGELTPGRTVRLEGRRAAHLLDVLRATPGTTLPAGELGGRMGAARVRSTQGRELELEVTLDRDPPPPSAVSLVLGLLRPKVLRRVLQAVAAAGVKRLVLLGSWRVEKSYWGSPLLRPEAIAAELRLGLEQGRDTVPPEVRLHRLFKPFVEDLLPTWCGSGARLLADPEAAPPLEGLRPGPSASAALVVGPEGGFTPYEAGRLAEQGFQAFSLGPRALRVDSALAFALGQVELWLRTGEPGGAGLL